MRIFKAVIKIIMLSSLLLSPLMANAIRWPVISNIVVTPNGSGAWIYTFQTQFQDLAGIPDPVLYNGDAVMLGHKHYDGTATNPPDAACYDGSQNCHEVAGKSYGVLASEAAQTLYNQYGKTARIQHGGATPGPQECVAYYIGKSGNAHAPWNSIYIPGGMGSCATVPPVNALCKITSPELVLDHGTLSLKDAEGSTKSASLAVDCTSSTKVVLRFTSDEPYIYLAPSGKAQVTINDQPLGSIFNLPKGASTLTVKDVLSGVTVGGQYVGTSVLVMNPY
ncbi:MULTISPECIES: MrpH family fimbial adhesin [Atlantibacter]|uniref:MrpH family fimbial adhesin n=1 Tax=Atlantibacter TaxID=1903434 RepID=UPI002073C00D|nr:MULTISPECIES: hypothetical protein [Atlantibacter]MCQ4968819.1 hypothetical protein [Enterobacteriaceae bacterium DFI.7.85]MDQ7882559.1 hypothetical protein [Atlantibacter hermannii]MDU1952784.1 hypothetical protein [Atlantibacter hermannii]MDW4575217.1 hypothetical protein [Atlantibacter hermannii]WIF57741.1 hypothetical protein QN094_17445 [Atlantibacter hermannii]